MLIEEIAAEVKIPVDEAIALVTNAGFTVDGNSVSGSVTIENRELDAFDFLVMAKESATSANKPITEVVKKIPSTSKKIKAIAPTIKSEQTETESDTKQYTEAQGSKAQAIAQAGFNQGVRLARLHHAAMSEAFLQETVELTSQMADWFTAQHNEVIDATYSELSSVDISAMIADIKASGVLGELPPAGIGFSS